MGFCIIAVSGPKIEEFWDLEDFRSGKFTGVFRSIFSLKTRFPVISASLFEACPGRVRILVLNMLYDYLEDMYA